MEKYVKNVWLYHLIADGPMAIFFYYYFEFGRPLIPMVIFGGIIYPFIYRPFIDYYRLLALGVIKVTDFRKMWKWGTLYRFKYYSKLMFGV